MEHELQTQGEIVKSQKVADMNNLNVIYKIDLKNTERNCIHER